MRSRRFLVWLALMRVSLGLCGLDGCTEIDISPYVGREDCLGERGAPGNTRTGLYHNNMPYTKLSSGTRQENLANHTPLLHVS